MPNALILSQELRSLARRWSTYQRRFIVTIGMLLTMAIPFLAMEAQKWKYLTVHETARFAQSVFGVVALTQILLTVWLVPACVAGVIAEERERRRLTQLLTTQLTSAEIVVGKLAGGLAQYAACLAAGVPILSVMTLLGGVDPQWVFWTYAGTCSTAYLFAGLSLVIATGARRRVRAVGVATVIAVLWCTVPLMSRVLVPSVYPRLWPWIHEANDLFLATVPTGVILIVFNAGPGWRLTDAALGMIGLQLFGGSVLIAWAVARFRRACRQADATESIEPKSLWSVLRRPKPSLGRFPCRENPVLWKELYTSRPRGISYAVAWLCALGLAAFVGYHAYLFARPAFIEWHESGFGRGSSQLHRGRFNEFLRVVSTILEFLILMVVAEAAAGSISEERARETWDGLISTTLTNRTILRAKQIAAVWKVRWGVLLLVAFWLAGLATGSLHPLGVALALVLLAAATSFMAALGTYQSLVARDTAHATNRTLVSALVLFCSFLACFLPARIASILYGCGSVPFLTFVALMSYSDVDDLMSAGRTSRLLEWMSINTFESPARVLAALLLGATGFAIGAVWFIRAVDARFDELAGRPDDVRKLPENASAMGLLISGLVRWLLRRRAAVGLLLAVVLLTPVAAYFLIPAWRDQQSLKEALVETDRLDPGWHLEDLEASRRPVPDLVNGAFRVLSASRALSARWVSQGDMLSDAAELRRRTTAKLAPPQCLAAEDLRALEAEQNTAIAALTDGRRLADLPQGRFPVEWADDGVSTRLPQLAKSRDVVNFLAYEILLRSHRQEIDEALSACRAVLNTGRAFGDEPAAISQRLRMDIRKAACQQVELALAHGEASEGALAKLQQLLQSEEKEPLLVTAIKGERAIVDRLLTSIDSGRFTPQQVRNSTMFPTVLYIFHHTNATRAAHLRFYLKVESLAARGAAEQLAGLGELELISRDQARDLNSIAPAMRRLAIAFHNSRARLRRTYLAVAAERYRIARGSWPTDLGALVPDFLADIPNDPFGDVPFRLTPFKDGIAICSVGDDVADELSEITSDTSPVATHGREIRLWHVHRRHQPAGETTAKPRDS